MDVTLDNAVLRRVKVSLEEVATSMTRASEAKLLTGDLAGYWRHGVGDWRVIVEIGDEELVIVAIGLGHRSEIYRGR